MNLFQAPTSPNAALSQHLLRSRPIAVHRHVLAIAGSPAAGILLSQLVYWTRRGIGVSEQRGWIHKTAEQWSRETGMSWKLQRRARRDLAERGLIEERTTGMPRRTEYRLNLNAFAARTSELIQIQLQDDFVSLDLFRTDDIVVKQLLGQAVSYHRVLSELTPHVNDALLLSRLIHDQRQVGRWLIRSRTDWLRELCMSRDEWETSRRHLRHLGVLVEQQSNFPRRVNLMVDQANLVRALNKHAQGRYVKAQPMARTPHGTWAASPILKATIPAPTRADSTVGGIGRFCTSGIPSSESPNPAYPNPAQPNPSCTDRPIPPLEIAQSRLYMNSEGLQEPLQPKNRLVVGVDAARGEHKAGLEGVARPGPALAPNFSSPKLQTSGLDSEPIEAAPGVARAGPPPQNRPIPPSLVTAGLTPDQLVWPEFLSEEHKVGIWWHLCSISHRAQEVLDEMAWCHQQTGVKNPIGLVRHLATLVNQGAFVAEGAVEIQRRRQAKAAASQQQDRLASAGMDALRATPPAAPQATEASAQIRARLRERVERARRSGLLAPAPSSGSNP